MIKISRNTAIERLRKVEMAKTATGLWNYETLSIPLNNKWKVRYLNMPGTFYVIGKLLESCDCKIVSWLSSVSTCTCLDATLHATICKHIHLVYMETSDNVVCKDRTSTDTNYHILLMYSLPKVKKKDLETAKETLLLKIYTLEM